MIENNECNEESIKGKAKLTKLLILPIFNTYMKTKRISFVVQNIPICFF